MPNEDIDKFLLWCPITIIADRYSGTYSGAVFTAWLLENDELPNGAIDNDIACREFWYGGESKYYLIGKGDTPQQSYDDLINKVKNLAIDMKNGLYSDTNYEKLTYYDNSPNSKDYENIGAIVREFNDKENSNNA